MSKYFIAHCNPESGWLKTRVNTYNTTGDYLVLGNEVSLLQLTGSPLIVDFSNIINHFTGVAADEWAIKNIKVTQTDTYDLTHQEPYETEMDLFDISGNITGSETVTGLQTVVDATIPVLDLKITDYSLTIPNSERSWFTKSTDLPENVESGVVNIWNAP